MSWNNLKKKVFQECSVYPGFTVENIEIVVDKMQNCYN